MILISNDFWHKRKIANCDPYNVLLAIATNISQRLRTAFVLQGHMSCCNLVFIVFNFPQLKFLDLHFIQ